MYCMASVSLLLVLLPSVGRVCKCKLSYNRLMQQQFTANYVRMIGHDIITDALALTRSFGRNHCPILYHHLQVVPVVHSDPVLLHHFFSLHVHLQLWILSTKRSNYPSPAWEHSDLVHKVVQGHDSVVMIHIDDHSVEMADVDLDVSGMQLAVRRILNRVLQPFRPCLMSCLLPFEVEAR